jgi:SAM-dependent methyltransferase
VSDLPTSSEYWRNKAGAEYRDQQVIRAGGGNASYREQEQWLQKFLGDLARELGRPPRVLDFGCGFGRFTRLLLKLDYVDYYGYDFSSKMVEPLFADPPIETEELHRRVRVADGAAAAFPEGGFDVIFTVSVLIHNPPDAARRLLEQMLELTTQSGSIVLIENGLSALSIRENSWHAGCWLHDVAGTLAPELNVDVRVGIVPGHAIYVLSRPTAAGRVLRMSEAGSASSEVSLADLQVRGLERLALGLRGIEEELELGARSVGELHDQWELLSAAQEAVGALEVERDRLSSEVSSLLAKVDQLSAQQAALERTFESRSELRRSIARLITEQNQAPERIHGDGGSAFEPEVDGFFQWNDRQDTQFAHVDARFASVAHVFHMEWKGIRAAAGCLPGNKLAIKCSRPPSAQDVEQILELLRGAGVDRIVIHGMSDAMLIMHALLAQKGLATFLVWHGTTAQWAWPDERRFALMALKLSREGKVNRFSAIRRGLEEVAGSSYFMPQLLNPVPRLGLDIVLKPTGKDRLTALVPSWNDLRKNLATNLLAAEGVDRIEKTYVFAKDLDLPPWIVTKAVRIKYPGPHALPNVVRGVDIVMNVTTIDCHPMVDLEALACRVPCIRGPLFLDALEDHQYAVLTTVDNPLSVVDVAKRTRHVLSVPNDEMHRMMADYADRLTKVAIDRYAEFTGV